MTARQGCERSQGEVTAGVIGAEGALESGYHNVPAGKVAFVVTCLEMRARPSASLSQAPGDIAIRRVVDPGAGWYRDLYRRIGANWLWFSRLRLSASGLEATIRDPAVAVYALAVAGHDEGLLELDFRIPGQCEISFLGLTAKVIGRGGGRALIERAIEEAWQRPIQRLWVHTCTGDHPAALAFYMRAGFVPYGRQIEIADDPRLSGLIPATAAPHVFCITPA